VTNAAEHPTLVVVLPDPFRGMEAWRNSMLETEQSGHAPRSGPEVKNRSGVKDGAPKRLGCRTIQEEASQILQRVFAGAAPSSHLLRLTTLVATLF